MFCEGDRLTQAVDMLPLLLQTVEKAAGQPTQVPIVSEGVAASCLLVRLPMSDIETGTA